MITIFGSINLDLIGSVGRLPRPGETVLGGAFETAPGGKGANQALAAARAGAEVRMIGAVGQDSFAEAALALLRDGGVELSRVRSVAEPTGVALILVDSAGENVIAVIPGANNTMGPGDVGGLDFTERDVLVLQLEVPVAGLLAVARRARAGGARVLLNFAPFHEEALQLMPAVTHLIVNESECELVARSAGASGSELADQAASLASRYGVTVIVTLGKDGVIAVENGVPHRAEALPVQAIDTVGAGDTFCGYLAAAFSEGLSLAEALALSARAASLACTKSGAQPSMPMRPEVDAAGAPLNRA